MEIIMAVVLIMFSFFNLNARTPAEEFIDVDVSVASQIKQKVSEAPGAVWVITAEEIERMGARDLRDVLRLVPGFEIGMRDIGYTRIGVRGVSTPNSEKVKILVDDIPINEHLEGSATVIFSELPLDNVARIEIIRGPASSLYGASAFAGVIRIVTKRAGQVKGFNVTLKGGNFQTKEMGILLGKCLKDFKIEAYFNYFDTGGMKIPIEEDALSRNTDDPFNRAVSLAGTDGGHTLEGRKKITASLNLSYKNLYVKGLFLDLDKEHYYSTSGAAALGSEPRASQLNGMLGYKFKIDEKIEIEPRLYTIVYEVDNLWQIYPPGYRETLSGLIYPHGQFELVSITEKTFGLDFKCTYKISFKNTLVIGASYENITFTNDGVYNNTGRPGLTRDKLVEGTGIMRRDPMRRVFSSYIQDQWNIAKGVTLTAGMRYDNYDDVGSTVNSRFAVVWNPMARAAVKLLYGQAFRVPTFAELYLFAMDGFFTGNIRNRPETVRTGELELGCQLSDNIHCRINFFYTTIDDLIDMVFFSNEAGVPYHIEYRNMEADTVIRGLEAETRVLLGKNSYGFINYSFQEGKNKRTDAKLTGMARHIVNAGLNLGLSKNINLNITANMVGPRAREPSDPRQALKGYALVNAALMGKTLIKNMRLFLSVYNLFNADCRFPDFGGNLPNDFPLPNSARSFTLGIKYMF
jgi:iron complex outermembrane receptor protein